MGRQRREFIPEYKDEAVRLVINTGRAVATVARELGINEATLGRWVNAFRACQDAGDGALSIYRRSSLGCASGKHFRGRHDDGTPVYRWDILRAVPRMLRHGSPMEEQSWDH